MRAEFISDIERVQVQSIQEPQKGKESLVLAWGLGFLLGMVV